MSSFRRKAGRLPNNVFSRLRCREIGGIRKQHMQALTGQLFNKLPGRLGFTLRTLVQESVLREGHVFLGFTKNGQFVLSYTLHLEADDHSAYPAYVYWLQWWHFIPYRRLRKIAEVRLFGDVEIQQDLLLNICEWPDNDTKLVVHGYCIPADNEEKRQCYITITAAPPVNPCLDCLQLSYSNSNSVIGIPRSDHTAPPLCLCHSYTVHCRYELAPPYPAFCPRLFLKCSDIVLVNTGDSLVTLSVHLEEPLQVDSIQGGGVGGLWGGACSPRVPPSESYPSSSEASPVNSVVSNPLQEGCEEDQALRSPTYSASPCFPRSPAYHMSPLAGNAAQMSGYSSENMCESVSKVKEKVSISSAVDKNLSSAANDQNCKFMVKDINQDLKVNNKSCESIKDKNNGAPTNNKSYISSDEVKNNEYPVKDNGRNESVKVKNNESIKEDAKNMTSSSSLESALDVYNFDEYCTPKMDECDEISTGSGLGFSSGSSIGFIIESDAEFSPRFSAGFGARSGSGFGKGSSAEFATSVTTVNDADLAKESSSTSCSVPIMDDNFDQICLGIETADAIEGFYSGERDFNGGESKSFKRSTSTNSKASERNKRQSESQPSALFVDRRLPDRKLDSQLSALSAGRRQSEKKPDTQQSAHFSGRRQPERLKKETDTQPPEREIDVYDSINIASESDSSIHTGTMFERRSMYPRVQVRSDGVAVVPQRQLPSLPMSSVMSGIRLWGSGAGFEEPGTSTDASKIDLSLVAPSSYSELNVVHAGCDIGASGYAFGYGNGATYGNSGTMHNNGCAISTVYGNCSFSQGLSNHNTGHNNTSAISNNHSNLNISHSNSGCLSSTEAGCQTATHHEAGLSPTYNVGVVSGHRDSHYSDSCTSCSSCVSCSPIILQNESKCFTYSVRRYSECLGPLVRAESPAADVEDDLSLAYHSLLPLEVRGSSYTSLKMITNSDYKPVTPCLAVKQLTLDIEHYLGEAVRTCADWGHRYLAFTDYDVQVLEVCADTAEVIAFVFVLIRARPPREDKHATSKDIRSIPKLYDTGFKLSWNLQTGSYKTLGVKDLVEVNQAELLRTKRWHPGHNFHRICQALHQKCAIPTLPHQAVHVMTNEAVFNGSSLKMLFDRQNYSVILL